MEVPKINTPCSKQKLGESLAKQRLTLKCKYTGPQTKLRNKSPGCFAQLNSYILKEATTIGKTFFF